MSAELVLKSLELHKDDFALPGVTASEAKKTTGSSRSLAVASKDQPSSSFGDTGFAFGQAKIRRKSAVKSVLEEYIAQGKPDYFKHNMAYMKHMASRAFNPREFNKIVHGHLRTLPRRSRTLKAQSSSSPGGISKKNADQKRNEKNKSIFSDEDFELFGNVLDRPKSKKSGEKTDRKKSKKKKF